MTLRIHDGKYTSLLDKAYDTEGGQNVNMSGVLNLVVILLVLTNIRNIMISLKRNGFTLSQVLTNYYETRKEFMPKIYNDLALILLIPVFVLITYWIEYFASKKVNKYVIVFLTIVNQTALLAYPIAASFIFKPNFIIASTLC